MTRDDWILLGAGTLGLLAVGAVFLGKSRAPLNPYVTPLYAGSEDQAPDYMSYNAPKTFIPVSSTAPCGCGAAGTTLLGAPSQLASAVAGYAQGILANMQSV